MKTKMQKELDKVTNQIHETSLAEFLDEPKAPPFSGVPKESMLISSEDYTCEDLPDGLAIIPNYRLNSELQRKLCWHLGKLINAYPKTYQTNRHYNALMQAIQYFAAETAFVDLAKSMIPCLDNEIESSGKEKAA